MLCPIPIAANFISLVARCTGAGSLSQWAIRTPIPTPSAANAANTPITGNDIPANIPAIGAVATVSPPNAAVTTGIAALILAMAEIKEPTPIRIGGIAIATTPSAVTIVRLALGVEPLPGQLLSGDLSLCSSC